MTRADLEKADGWGNDLALANSRLITAAMRKLGGRHFLGICLLVLAGLIPFIRHASCASEAPMLVKVESSSIAAVAYDDRVRVLEVMFRAGARYRGVPAEVYGELMRADSKGRYFAKKIRGRFPFARVPSVQP